jgi:hypothetical protein
MIYAVCIDVNGEFHAECKFVVGENICDVSNSWSGVSIGSNISGNALVSSIRSSIYKPCDCKVIRLCYSNSNNRVITM